MNLNLSSVTKFCQHEVLKESAEVISLRILFLNVWSFLKTHPLRKSIKKFKNGKKQKIII